MRRAVPVKDRRNPRVAIDKPPFGNPPEAAECSGCQLWYPWRSFYRGRKKARYRTCLNCRRPDT